MALAQLSGAVINDGIDGKNNIILSDTEPIEPVVGQLWQNTSSTPEIVKEWDGSDWVTWGLYAPNINVDTLSALAISTGALTNVYETNHPTYGKHNGTVKINNDGFKIEDIATLSDGKFKGTKVDITGSTQGITGIFMQEIPDVTVPTKFQQVWYMADRAFFTDTVNGFTGSLTAEMVYDTGWMLLPIKKGSGKIYARRWMGRRLIRFEDYIYNAWSFGTVGNEITIIDSKALPTFEQMVAAPVWADGTRMLDKFQFDTQGRIWKLSNNSTTSPITGVIEYF
ncbi:MAG: hypothetical protein LKF42_08650 [Streptococcaceae bacterium]|jgi:hypothetical protein|nr:hypothetical protein [Streptococcaceae bacterium]MCH4177308.1 hypothetical protein [Streptococcaceae bacterium]